MRLELLVKGDEKVQADIERMADRARSPQVAFGAIAGLLQQGIQRQFSSQGSYGGTPWPPLSSESRSSGAPLTSLAGTFTVRRIAKTRVTIGSRHPLVRIHQGGAAEGRKGVLPARPMAVIGPGTRRQALSTLTRYLLGQ